MDVALPSNSANEPAIHRLVDDILAYIFLLNATPDPKSKNQPTIEHATTVASSQVCTRWRSIALNSRSIWSLIIDYPRHSLKWIEILLDRSNPSLLDFGSRINKVLLEELVDGGQGVLELVFNHIDRLRIFNLRVPASFWELHQEVVDLLASFFRFLACHKLKSCKLTSYRPRDKSKKL
jgi:hypothetical protein